jgi:galactokinase
MATERALEAFQQHFGGEPAVLAVAPGRVNLIGEHTDYNDGFVFPAAIDLQLYVAARPTDGPSRLISLEIGEGRSFDVKCLEPYPTKNWTAYAAGIAWAIQHEGFENLPNIEAVVHSGVPIGSGVSSSAALELAFGVVWNRLCDLGLINSELAKLGQKCENQFVGLNCGIMDQMASACGKEGHAMFLDTRSLEIQYAPIPKGLSIVLCDTRKPRALTSSAYNERRGQCEEVARLIGVKALRDATLAQLESLKGKLPEVSYRRALHVITEDLRSHAYKKALSDGDLAKVGELMRKGHESLRDDYEVSCPELDVMAQTAWEAPGCIGARMTGAGFGGACVALVKTNETEAFADYVAPRYQSGSGLEGGFIVCQAVDGAHVI